MRGLAKRDVQPPTEYRGRKPGVLAGTEITDLASLEKSILLCELCRMKFDHKRWGYMLTQRWGYVVGKCDACATPSNRNHFYVHERFENEVYTP